MTPRRDTGSATVLVLGLAAVLALVAVLAVGVTGADVARHRADGAADLAALAAATRALDGEGAACRAAARTAALTGARAVSCRLDGDVATVVVEARLPGRLEVLRPLHVTARAGPGATSRPRSVPTGGPAVISLDVP